MKVTKLSVQKRDPSRVNMYIDDDFFCGISLDSVAKFGIYIGRTFEQKELEGILFNELKNRFLNRTISYLSRSVRTEFQLRKYLRELSLKKQGIWFNEMNKEDLEEIFNKVIAKLNKYGYIDDREFAEQFVLSRIKNKPRGKMILISELMSKGVSKDTASEVVDSLVEDEYDVLKRVYFKKFKNEKITIKDRKKIDFLKRKGFSWDLIENFINDESTK